MRLPAISFALLVASTAGCGPVPAVERGRELFSSPAFSKAPSNVFSCATCHATTPESPADRRYAGYTLHDAARRPSYWGGQYARMLDAVNECVTEFMRGAPVTADDEDGRALFVYLESIAPSETAPALPLTVVKDIVDVPNGDATRGARLWDAACAVCHGDTKEGKGRPAAFIPILPAASIAEHGTDPVKGARPITIEKVRHGKYYGIGGNMPLYSVEALSDAELGDLLAFLGL